jgi:hypothetical protein
MDKTIMPLNPKTIPASPDPEAAVVTSLNIHPGVRLVDASTVQAKHGCDSAEVLHMVDSGDYIWAFDFSTRGSKTRRIRFLVDEVINPKAVQDIGLDAAIDRILPPYFPKLKPGSICQRFLISRSTWMRLRQDLHLKSGKVLREPLAEFLRSRWMGDGK